MNHDISTIAHLLKPVMPEMPRVGDGASYGAGSDSYPATVIEVKGKKVTIQDDSMQLDPVTKEFIYMPNPEGPKRTYTLRKTGRFIEEGASISAYWASCSFGKRCYYRDPSF